MKLKGISTGELVKRLSNHLVKGGSDEEIARQTAESYYRSHGITFSKEELERRAAERELKENTSKTKENTATEDLQDLIMADDNPDEAWLASARAPQQNPNL